MTKIKSKRTERWVQWIPSKETKNKGYWVSDFGRVKSIDKVSQEERIITGSLLRQGFYRVNVKFVDNTSGGFFPHRVLGEYFVEREKENQIFLVHLDGRKTNSYYKNLKWMSKEELTAWQRERGDYDPQNQKRHPNTKMTATKVLLLKRRLKAGRTKKKVLANSFGITITQLLRIERGENWGHVKV